MKQFAFQFVTRPPAEFPVRLEASLLLTVCALLATMAAACRETSSPAKPATSTVAQTAQPSAVKTKSIQPTTPPGGIPAAEAFTQRTQLIDNPNIINAHEHVAHDGPSLKTLEQVNGELGITRTVLLGSSRNTLRLDQSGFIEHHANNEYLCKVARENPEKYYAFVTFDPLEEGIVEKLAEYLKNGATGVKLYLGHGAECAAGVPYHSYDLDDPRILPLYDYCQSHRVPLLFHVNLRKYEREMHRVLSSFPNLPVILPHFALKLDASVLGKLDTFMEKHPSVYLDISFGWPQFQQEGLERIHKNTKSVQSFFVKYQDRIFFGTDVVVTPGKDVAFVRESFLAYRRMLELSEYDYVIKWGQFDYAEHFKGLALSDPMLRKIYRENFEKLMVSCLAGR